MKLPQDKRATVISSSHTKTALRSFQPRIVYASVLICLMLLQQVCSGDESGRNGQLALRYEQPAKDWMTEALPIGNGRLGAMLFGGVELERIQFNEISLWTGDEQDTGAYQNFGNIYIDMGGVSVTEGENHLSCSASETISASVDGSPDSKWCVEHHGQEIVWIKRFSSQGAIVTSYSFTSANDVSSRDPQTWVLEASGDGQTWQVLDKKEKEPPFEKRKTKHTYTFENKTPYVLYRLRFTPTDATHFQVAEIELGSNSKTTYSNYTRELSIDTATQSVAYTRNGVHFQREAFASHPDQVIVLRLTADKPGQYDGSIRLADAHQAPTKAKDNRLVISGALNNGLEYEAQVLIVNEGGKLTVENNEIRFIKADSLTIYLAAGTSYLPNFEKHWRGENPSKLVTQQLFAASKKPLTQLRTEHIADYQKLFNRVELNVGTSDKTVTSLATDHRLLAYSKGGYDPELEELFFQFGRYLLISSSREGGLPANLQGLWNDSNDPPWRSDYHSNINIQMNYWPAEVTGLPECHIPMLDYINNQREVRKIATQKYYNCKRGWTVQTENNIYGGSSWNWNPPASAWYCQHLWEHYAFSADKTFLKNFAYPILKEVCEFWEDRLQARPDGTLVTPDGWSPEHGPHEPGVTYDQEIVWDLFNNYVEASTILNIDPEYRQKITELRGKLLKPSIGKWGQLMEWAEDIDDPKDTHRHVSHLFALHPGRQISPSATPDLAAAAKKSLEARGDLSTGWAMAWRINFWARLQDGDHAYRLLRNLMKLVGHSDGINYGGGGGLYANLFDAHPPFQIDGNFGAPAGIAEMLIQSQAGEIMFLPALPKAWPEGSAKGLRARGGITLTDMKWKDGKLVSVELVSNQDGAFHLRYAEKTGVIELKAGVTTRLNSGLAVVH